MDQHRPPILTITKAPDTNARPSSSPPDRKLKAIFKTSSLETVPESDLDRTQPRYVPHPADAPKPAVREPSSSLQNSEKGRLANKHSQHYHNALHERSAASAAASVRGEALIYAELKTNIENEQHLLTTMANHLAARYNRQPSSTIISLHHSQSLLFSGSPSPAYMLTVTALACEVQPATNKRNAAVLQKHLADALRVPPARGMVRFVPVAEECLAWGGKTVAGRISDAVAVVEGDVPVVEAIYTSGGYLAKSSVYQSLKERQGCF
ncbi:hypothetical protein A9Z42_0088240 [Trichoderma parareesei]|uniref:L-dopachrome isomerase n=1 Tax=Trichoderma parareesei TaxID=858221 RepID=A0A2H2ZKM3_TRIPA|nr:hypothetical protein A9Z42_0088240 [Trichoderma parareesei]